MSLFPSALVSQPTSKLESHWYPSSQVIYGDGLMFWKEHPLRFRPTWDLEQVMQPLLSHVYVSFPNCKRGRR